MSKKQYGNWYGRPNRPPLNWDTPDKPAMRGVTGWLDDEVERPEDDARDLVAVSFTNDHWISILKALHRYSQEHGDKNWQQWRLGVRSAILGAVNPNTDATKAVAVELTIEDWRLIWKYTQAGCESLGDEWTSWFKWLSHTMTEQIKKG